MKRYSGQINEKRLKAMFMFKAGVNAGFRAQGNS